MAGAEDLGVTKGSDNIFADIGVTDARSHKLKAELVLKLRLAIKEKKLTQDRAAQLLDISQPDVSKLLRGSFRDVSLERLMRHLTRLEMDVDITVRRRGEAAGDVFHVEAG